MKSGLKKYNSYSLLLGLMLLINVYLPEGSGVINAQDVNVARITSPCPGEFPIVASGIYNKTAGPKAGDLDGVRDCGFNLCMEEASVSVHEKILANMEGIGLKYLPYSYSFGLDDKENWQVKMRTFVRQFGNNSLIAGWHFGDEPKWKDLPEFEKRFRYLQNLDNKKFIVYNLVGQLHKSFTGPCRNLSTYLDSIASRFPMQVWSSDVYPIMYRNGQLKVDYKGFFNDLKAFSKKSKETSTPMWTYCSSLEYEVENILSPAATVPYLSFEAFSSLAYGAQGIVYYTYWQRPTVSGSAYKNISALVDLDGNRTKAWYAAQKINLQIRALTSVFLGAQMDEVRHTGTIDMDGTYPNIRDFGPLEELTNGTKGVLVSRLHNEGHKYLVIVNHDVQKKQKVKMKFKKDLTVNRLVASDAGKLTSQNVKSSYNVTITPGGYAIFEY